MSTDETINCDYCHIYWFRDDETRVEDFTNTRYEISALSSEYLIVHFEKFHACNSETEVTIIRVTEIAEDIIEQLADPRETVPRKTLTTDRVGHRNRVGALSPAAREFLNSLKPKIKKKKKKGNRTKKNRKKRTAAWKNDESRVDARARARTGCSLAGSYPFSGWLA